MKSRIWTILKWTLTAAVLILVGLAMKKQVAKLDWRNLHLAWGWLLPALLCDLGSRATLAMASHALFRSLGVPLPARVVLPITWISMLGKYMPGKIATLGSAVWFFSRHGVRAELAGLVPLLANGLLLLAALLLSVPALFHPAVAGWLGPFWWLALPALAAALVAFHPAVFMRLLNLGVRLLKRPPVTERLTVAGMLPATAWVLLTWILLGLTTFFICRAFAPLPWTAAPLVVEGTLVAGLAGIAAFFAPAGIGAREGALLVMLGDIAWIPVVVILLRLLQTVSDLAMGGLGWAMLPAAEKKSE